MPSTDELALDPHAAMIAVMARAVARDFGPRSAVATVLSRACWSNCPPPGRAWDGYVATFSAIMHEFEDRDAARDGYAALIEAAWLVPGDLDHRGRVKYRLNFSRLWDADERIATFEASADLIERAMRARPEPEPAIAETRAASAASQSSARARAKRASVTPHPDLFDGRART